MGQEGTHGDGREGGGEIENMQLFNAFTWQQWLHERVSLRHMHILVLQYTEMDVMFLNDTLAGNLIYDSKVPLLWAHQLNTDGHSKYQVP